MIHFKVVRYKNLLSSGNIFTEIQLDKAASTLILGINGSGKSTLLDAISFALFGRAFRKINKPQLVNTITNKHLVVEIEFSIGLDQYKIIRGIKPVIFEVFKNDTLLNQLADSRDYQTVLENQILKVNHKSFSQVVVLGSATFQPFMQLTAAQRREVVEDLLDLKIFTKMNVLLKNKVFQNNEKLTDNSYNAKIIEEKIKLTKTHLKEIKSNNEEHISRAHQSIKEVEEECNKIKDELASLNNEIKDKEKNIENYNETSLKLNRFQTIKHKIDAKASILAGEIEFFNKNDNCPTCKQKIEEIFKLDTLETKLEELNKILDGLDKLDIEIETLKKIIETSVSIQSQIKNLKYKRNSLESDWNAKQKYIVDQYKDIETLQRKVQNDDGYDSKIIEFEEKLEQLNNEYYELQEEKKLLSYTGTLLKDNGIKARIIKQYIPIINKLINKYLASFEFMCEFNLDEEFNEQIKSRFRDELGYNSFSQGEKQKIDLALLFTWRAIAKLRNSIHTNILIFDEILDSSLDGNAIDYFMAIIKNLTNKENVFIISHRDRVIDQFDDVIKFVKKSNFSKIEEINE